MDDERDDLRSRSRRYRSSIRRKFRRKKTTPTKRITRASLAAGWVELGGSAPEPVRPKTRADCVDGPRPCPWVACKHHLYLDVNPNTGSITINFPDLEPWELQHTCALDVAEADDLTLEAVGDVLNITRERVRQIEVRAVIAKLRGPALEAGLDEVWAEPYHLSPLAEAQEMDVAIVPSELTHLNY